MQLTTPKERWERGDVITIYKIINNLEEIYWTKSDNEKKRTCNIFERIQKRIAKRILLEQHKKYSFPLRSIDTWHGLEKEEVIVTNNVQQPKKNDICKYRDRMYHTSVGQALYVCGCIWNMCHSRSIQGLNYTRVALVL